MTCSGKTTLLTHILTTQHGKKIAVILNEFGEYYSWMKRNKIRKMSNLKKHGVIRLCQESLNSYTRAMSKFLQFESDLDDLKNAEGTKNNRRKRERG